jgi:hypothetical protein
VKNRPLNINVAELSNVSNYRATLGEEYNCLILKPEDGKAYKRISEEF